MKSSLCKNVLEKVSKFERKYRKTSQESKDEDISFSNNSKSNISENVEGLKMSTSNQVHKFVIENSSKGVPKNRTINYPKQDILSGCKAEAPKLTSKYFEERKELPFNQDVDEIIKSIKDAPSDYDRGERTIVGSQSIESIEKNTQNINISVGKDMADIKESRLKMNLNLKLDEDSDEISDISSQVVGSLALEDPELSESIHFNILTIEDLILAEDSKFEDSICEQVSIKNPNLRDDFDLKKEKLDQHESLSNVKDKLYFSQNTSEVLSSHKSIEEKIEHSSKIYTATDNSEVFSSTLVSIEESFISEDIPEIQEQEMKENPIEYLKNIETNETNTPLKNSISEEYANSKSIADKDLFSQQNNSNISNLYCESEYNHLIANQVSSDKSLQEILKLKMKTLETDIKLAYNQRNELAMVDGENSAAHMNNQKKRLPFLIKKDHLEKKDKLFAHSHVHNMASQTENIFMCTYEFEKRMREIMESSIINMPGITRQLDTNSINTKEICHSEFVMSPLEKGFHCALQQQLELTKSFIHAEYKMYTVCMTAIKEMSSTYKPATLSKMKNQGSKRK